jgi:enoyl-CoA hydratase/carnithine racemase
MECAGSTSPVSGRLELAVARHQRPVAENLCGSTDFRHAGLAAPSPDSKTAAMDYQDIQVNIADGIATITLNRPERLNAYTATMQQELLDALDRTDHQDDVRVVVFTGAGRAYCAGADLSQGAQTFAGGDGTFSMDAHADGGGVLTRRLFRSIKPLIAAINGPAVGVGVTATLPMDFRLATVHAKFGFVFTRRGVIPEACSSWFLPRIVGISQALDWTLSGRVFDAEEALRTGLVRSLHEPDGLLPAAYELARALAEGTSAVSVAIARTMLWRMLSEAGPEQAHEIESRGMFAMGSSPDAREGVTSFLEKRPAQFTMSPAADLPPFFERWREHDSVAAFLAEG